MSEGTNMTRETSTRNAVTLNPELAAARRWIAERLAFERFLAEASAESNATVDAAPTEAAA